MNNLTGILTTVGTDETGTPRAYVKLKEEEVAAVERLPRYEQVYIVPVAYIELLKEANSDVRRIALERDAMRRALVGLLAACVNRLGSDHCLKVADECEQAERVLKGQP